MDEEQKKQVAIFRFGVISDFVNDWIGASERGCSGRNAPANGRSRVRVALVFDRQRFCRGFAPTSAPIADWRRSIP
jgi:hypothetical protein